MYKLGKSLKKHIILKFIVISMIPLISISIFIVFYTLSYYKNDLSSKSNSISDSLLVTINEYIDESSKNLEFLSSLLTDDDNQNIIDCFNKNDIHFSVIKFISYDKTLTYISPYDKTLIGTKIECEELKSIITNPTKNFTYCKAEIHDNGDKYINIIIPSENGIIIGSLNLSQLDNYINRGILDSQKSLYLIDTTNSTIIYKSNDDMLIKNTNLSEINFSKLNQKIKINNKKYIYSSYETNFNNFNIVIIESNSILFNKVYKLVFFIIGALLLIIALYIFITCNNIDNIFISLDYLINKTKKISSGDYDFHLKYTKYNEINELYNSINTMSTNIKSREEHIQESELKYKTLLLNIPEVIIRIVYTNKFKINFISENVKNIYGYNKEDLLDNNTNIIPKLIHEDDIKKIKNLLKDFKNNENTFSIEFKGLDSDGKTRYLYLNGKSVFKNNKFNYLDAVVLDITEKKLSYEKIEHLYQELDRTQYEIILTLSQAVEAKSGETGVHVTRVSAYSKLLALKYGLSESIADKIEVASLLHDIGKIGVDDNILKKPGKLTPEEFSEIKKHSAIGYDILAASNRELTNLASQIAYEHHERYDGSGYPRALVGEEISIYGRIVAIADVFDALTSDRVYRKAWPIDKVLKHIKDQSGKHFDPILVNAFLNNLDDFLEAKKLLN
ncbi:MAG: HD domain-containing phosphohydrolase [Clostridiaceae bacterium]